MPISGNSAVARVNEIVLQPETYGAVGDGVTNDTAAFQACIDAAIALNKNVLIKLQPKTYLINSAPRTDRSGNCILSIFDAATSSKNLTIEGAGPAAWFSMKTILKCTRTTDTYSASFGPPSIIGGGTLEQLGSQNFYSGMISCRWFKIELPENPSNAGIDALTFAGLDLDEVHVVAGDGIGAATTATNPWAFGFRLPTIYGSGIMRLHQTHVLQMYTAYVLYVSDHVRFDNAYAFNCTQCLGFQDPFTAGFHPIAGDYLMSERCNYPMAGWDPLVGAKSLTSGSPYISNLLLGVENFTSPFNVIATVLDANNLIKGSIDIHFWNGISVANSAGTITGGQNLRVRTPNTAFPGVVASAATITPPAADVFKVSGVAAIATITPSYPGRTITLIFNSTASLTTGGNIKNGTFAGALDKTVTLICDGTSWYIDN